LAGTNGRGKAARIRENTAAGQRTESTIKTNEKNMKRVFLLLLIVFVCMGGCHKYDQELHIEAPAQVEVQPTNETHYHESLEVKRIEFVQKLHELKKALRKPQQRIDTLIVLPARPIKGIDY
jgi:hypothetical protein